MNTLKKTAAGTLLGGALLVGGGISLAHAAPPAPQAVTGDGTVDIAVSAGGQQIGIIPNVSLASAASLAAAVCPTAGIDLPALTNLDVSGTVLPNACTGMTGLSFDITQNASVGNPNTERGNSAAAPGHNKVPGQTPPSANPSTPPGQQGR